MTMPEGPSLSDPQAVNPQMIAEIYGAISPVLGLYSSSVQPKVVTRREILLNRDSISGVAHCESVESEAYPHITFSVTVTTNSISLHSFSHGIWGKARFVNVADHYVTSLGEQGYRFSKSSLDVYPPDAEHLQSSLTLEKTGDFHDIETARKELEVLMQIIGAKLLSASS